MKKILIFSTYHSLANLMKVIIGRNFHIDVLLATEETEPLEQYKVHRPDLVIIDLEAYETQLVKKIKKEDNSQKIIGLTYEAGSGIKESISCSRVMLIDKPFDIYEFTRKIKACLHL
ncbi:DNA-binding NtrC family response regulator [Bacillus ectoiniformans]|uniref:hypothetical protein n=1 Tax=Bacillus ectoiniformans TaxID=1494429 RepID=UPI00195B57AC|nr:hypothetical protein [Bacillus ectoiniformans]MBM7649777.1 DNA-binding NtrC family response regulator [Bacillus ectoiniformans]